MLAHLAAPSIHRARRKARSSELDEARALHRAAWLWRATRVWVQVVFGGRVLAWVKGDPDHSRTLVSFGTDVPYGSQDDAVYKNSHGGHIGPIYWAKPIDTAVVIDNWYDTWGTDCNPQKGDWSGTARTARVFTNSTAGAMWTGGNVSPKKKYLKRASQFSPESTVAATLLYDRVLAYDACTMTAGSQSMTNTLAATRYISTGDPGLQIFVEADTVHNATAGNMTVLTYVNQAGTGGQVVQTTPTLALIPSIAAPTTTLGARSVFQASGSATKSLGGIYLNLQQGDQGVRSITNYTFSAAPTGTNSFVLQFPLALFMDRVSLGQSTDYEFLYGFEAINKHIYDDACLSWMINSHVTASPSIFQGMLTYGVS